MSEVSNYNYVLSSKTKNRNITKKEIDDLMKAINEYCKNPNTGKSKITKYVTPFIFTKLGFGMINDITLESYNKTVPTQDKGEALRKTVELIEIILNMITTNSEKMQIDKDNSNFLQRLKNKKAKCEMDLDDKSYKQKPKKNKSSKKTDGVEHYYTDSVSRAEAIIREQTKAGPKFKKLQGILNMLYNTVNQLEDGSEEKKKTERQIKKIEDIRDDFSKALKKGER